jgi:hypothetical protein
VRSMPVHSKIEPVRLYYGPCARCSIEYDVCVKQMDSTGKRCCIDCRHELAK